MIKTKSIALTSCLLALYCFSSALLSNEIIIYGNENKAPKYYFEDKKAKGILIDIMRYVDSKLPETFNYELYPWKRALYYASQAKGGIIGFSKNKERLKTFDYSDVMYSEVINLVVLQGHEFHYQNISSLQGKRIGVQRGSSYGDTFEKSKSTLTYHEDGSGEQRLLKLLNKRIDVALIGPGDVGLKRLINQNKLLIKNKTKFIVLPTPFIIDANYLAFSKKMNKQDLLQNFNKALAEGHKSGEIQKIIDKYSDPNSSK